MDIIKDFYDIIRKAEVINLATSENGSVTMRCVSPVFYQDKVLFFTSPDSEKYRQLKANPHCCINSGLYYAQAEAEFSGQTMLDINKELRDAYCEKFPGAFDEGLEFGGRKDDFILLTLKHLSGWTYENENHSEKDIPTTPFSIDLE
ncbi:MAG: pyridoxamine 5'-phosphate oxidase family protein [Oscillospiraceae bacterium]|nr:pyridoxamine 5'-phosphate oxidase family protein [Oscillospiraceae bacterium]